jgi:hypothetical protein
VDLVVGDKLAEHAARRRRALLDGVLPVLHSHLPIKDRMVVIRDITCSIDTADVGAAVLVNDNPVVEVNAAIAQHVHHWLDADPHDDEIALKAQPSPSYDGGYPPRPLEPGDGVIGDDANTMSTMEVSDRLSPSERRTPRRGTCT